MSAARLDLDPSRPYQIESGLLAIWLPRGRGRDDRARGLVASVEVCGNASCRCTKAALAAIPIDDRAAWAKRERGSIKLSWLGADDRAATIAHPLSLDFMSGIVTAARHAEVPPEVAAFFREPVPSWVLDDVYETWARLQPPLPEPWFERALCDWQPGEMLSIFLACPGARPDQFVRDGKRYVVDFVFCVEPGCACTANRFVVLEVDEADAQTVRWSQIAAAELDDGLTPRRIACSPEHRSTLSALYLDWLARSGNPRARFDELRARARERGAELRVLWEARDKDRRAATSTLRPLPAAAGAPMAMASGGLASTSVKPGRNDPCRCGSGKKYKRCCA